MCNTHEESLLQTTQSLDRRSLIGRPCTGFIVSLIYRYPVLSPEGCRFPAILFACRCRRGIVAGVEPNDGRKSEDAGARSFV